MKLEDRLNALSADCLRGILEDIWCEDEDSLDTLYDLDTSDLAASITEWVVDGVENKLWTMEDWTKEVLEDPNSPYMDDEDRRCDPVNQSH